MELRDRFKLEAELAGAGVEDKLIPEETRKTQETACIQLAEDVCHVLDSHFTKVAGRLGLTASQKIQLRQRLNQVHSGFEVVVSAKGMGDRYVVGLKPAGAFRSIGAAVRLSDGEPKDVLISGVADFLLSKKRLDTHKAVEKRVSEERGRFLKMGEKGRAVGRGWFSIEREEGERNRTYNFRELGQIDLRDGTHWLYGARHQPTETKNRLPQTDVVLERVKKK